MDSFAIHLQVCAGLANRIRAAVSGICFAEELNRPLVLHWPTGEPSCYGRFEALFDPKSLPSFVTVVQEYPNRHNLVHIYNEDELYKLKETQGANGAYNLKSYAMFWFHRSDKEQWLKHLRALKPSHYIQQRLSELNISPDNTLGVHIRRGDNDKSIQGSPLSVFLELLEVNPSPKFLVASDDMNVRTTLHRHFPGKCVFAARVLARSTEEGMVEGAIDFFALARCQTLLGSYYSSFTEIAALYGDSKLVIAKAH
jgi:hypothetical protein